MHPTWGSGHTRTDWKKAATKAGNAILAENPNHLIIVEGLNYANNMSPIKDDPIQLDIANRLVYSFHFYSWEQKVAKTDSYDELRDDLDKHVAFMLEENQPYTAPLWLGEFGTNSESDYWKYLIQYLGERPQIGWAYWAYNGYKENKDDDESFGLLEKDMKTVRHPWKLAALQSIQ